MRDFDIISEEIKMFSIFETKGRYKTLFGGLLSFLTFSLCISASIYFFMQIVYKTNPITYQASQYVDIAPRITFDSANLYFILYFWSAATNVINSSFITFQATQATIKSSETINEYNFGVCDIEEDLAGVYDLLQDFGSDVIQNSFCIKNMVLNGTLIPKNDSRFIAPYTDFGMESKAKDPINLSINGMQCINSTENNNSCLPSDEIDNILSNAEYRLMFLDNYFNPLDYNKPIVRFAERIVGSVGVGLTSYNYINYDNVKIQTNDGLIFDNIYSMDSYMFEDNVEIIQNQAIGDNTIFSLILEGENTAQIIERRYVRLQEVLASMGGVFKCLFLFAQIINFSYNRLMIQKNFLKKVYSNFISMKERKIDDDYFIKVNIDDQIPEENSNDVFAEDTRFGKEYHGEFSNFLIFKYLIHSYLEFIKDNDLKFIASPLKKEKVENIIKSLSIFPEKNKNEEDPQNESTIKPKKNRRSSLFSGLAQRQKSIKESAKLSFFNYSVLWVKNFHKRKKHELLENFDYTHKIKKKIFNEYTFYKLYFEMEKMKLIFFNEIQLQAFNLIKINYGSLFNEKNENLSDFKEVFYKIQGKTDDLSQKIAHLLIKNS